MRHAINRELKSHAYRQRTPVASIEGFDRLIVSRMRQQLRVRDMAIDIYRR